MKPRLSTIRAKVVAVMMTVSLVVGLTMFIGSLVLGYKGSQISLSNELKSIASVLAQSSQAAIAFNDEEAASLNIQSLAQVPHIT